MARRLITVHLRPVDACGPPADGEWFAQDVVVHLHIKCELFSLHGDSSLVFGPISIAPEILVFKPTPGASVKPLENKEEGEVVVEILGQVEAGSRDDTLVVVPTDMEDTICDAV
jgi:hypothetical protein